MSDFRQRRIDRMTCLATELAMAIEEVEILTSTTSTSEQRAALTLAYGALSELLARFELPRARKPYAAPSLGPARTLVELAVKFAE